MGIQFHLTQFLAFSLAQGIQCSIDAREAVHVVCVLEMIISCLHEEAFDMSWSFNSINFSSSSARLASLQATAFIRCDNFTNLCNECP